MKKVIAGILAAGMLCSATPFSFAGEVRAAIVSPAQQVISEKGSISFCEFIRAIVVVVDGEQPEIMDTHYAMPYMQKAKELGYISDDDMDFSMWNDAITRDRMTEVLGKLDAEDAQKAIIKVNTLLVEDITISGKAVDLTGLQAPYAYCGNVMIPLRKVAEALDFTVSWDQARRTASLDNGLVKTKVQIGYDGYYMQSSQAIGLTPVTGLGAAPRLCDGSTYVPARMFEILFSNPDLITVEDGVLNFLIAELE